MYRLIPRIIGSYVVFLFCLLDSVSAQTLPGSVNNSYRKYLNVPNPMSSVLNNPSVSPYLSLLNNNDSMSGIPSYHTAVRPRLEARDQRQRQNKQIRRLQSQTSNMRRDMARSNQRGGAFATGHPTRFGNYLHYYQSMRR